VTRGFMGPLGGFWPKLGRKRVTGWKQRSCVPPGRVKTNKQTTVLMGNFNKDLKIHHHLNRVIIAHILTPRRSKKMGSIGVMLLLYSLFFVKMTQFLELIRLYHYFRLIYCSRYAEFDTFKAEND
jgi:hypothetical protein